MSDDDDTLTLQATKHDKLGIIHCGVTREGFIAVGGEPRNIADGEEIRTGIYKTKALKPTGAGDSFMAGYLFQRLKGMDVPAAGRFAAALATVKLERQGAFSGTEAEVWTRAEASCSP